MDFRWRFERKRKRSPLNTREGALLYEATLRKRLCAGEPLDGPEPIVSVTFAEFAAEWFETYVKTNNKASGCRAKRSILDRHLLPAFGSLSLRDFEPSVIDRYKATALGRGLHPKSVNNQLAVLRRCLRSAQEWGRVEAVPRVVPLKSPPAVVTFLSDTETESLLADDRDPVAHAMVTTALHTGIRIGEMMALEWRDLDFDGRILTVERSVVRGVVSSPKSNRIRHVPMSDELVTVLSPVRHRSGLVFPRAEGTHLSDSMASVTLKHACRRAGIRRVGWHTLRHTFATRLVARGVPLRAVQQLLGHSTITMTERYAHVAPGTLRDAIAVLSAPRHSLLVGNQWSPRASATPSHAGARLITFP